MALTDQSDPFTMHRFVRDNLTPRPAVSSRAAPPPLPSEYSSSIDKGVSSSLEEDVTQSIRSIEHVVSNFGALKENFHFYKNLVSELQTKLDEEKAQREEVQREVTAVERMIRTERDRAMKAEQQVKTSENVIRDLEDQLSSLQSQTARLVDAISLLITADADVRDETEANLRLVS